MDTERFASLSRSLSTLRSRRTVAGAFGLSALAMPHLAGARKKRKHKKKTCPACPESDTCPERVCCECHALGPVPGCHIVNIDHHPSPGDTIAACDEACGGHQHVIGGDTSYPLGGQAAVCDLNSKCLRVQCPI